MDDYGFKFRIGQFVQHVGKERFQADAKKRIWPHDERLFIVQRELEECPGGVQRHYVCRNVNLEGSFTEKYFRLNEIELTEADEPSRTDEP